VSLGLALGVFVRRNMDDGLQAYLLRSSISATGLGSMVMVISWGLSWSLWRSAI
jgi:hypothetical protein